MEGPNLTRVTADIAAGRMWKARDRLNGHLVAYPTSEEIIDLLGEVHFRMGDLPQAGRYWYLSRTDGTDAAAARAAFHERFGHNPHVIAYELPVRAPINSYPGPVRDRLEHLQTAGGKFRVKNPKGSPPKRKQQGKVEVVLVTIMVLVLTVGIWGVGLISLFKLLADLP